MQYIFGGWGEGWIVPRWFISSDLDHYVMFLCPRFTARIASGYDFKLFPLAIR